MGVLILQICVVFYVSIITFNDIENVSIFFNSIFSHRKVNLVVIFGVKNKKFQISSFQSVTKNKKNYGKIEIFTQNKFSKNKLFLVLF